MTVKIVNSTGLSFTFVGEIIDRVTNVERLATQPIGKVYAFGVEYEEIKYNCQIRIMKTAIEIRFTEIKNGK